MGLLLSATVAPACGKPPPPRVGVSPEVVAIAKNPLDSLEKAVLAREGVVVTHKTAPSFHVGYTSLFREHQPVYVTADSLLEAWHSSYSSIFGELEEKALVPAQIEMITSLRENLRNTQADAQARADVDVFLGVAASLAEGRVADAVAGGDRAEIKEIAHKVHGGEGRSGITLFGQRVEFDFARFAPRGYYRKSPELQRYFRASAWLRSVEMRIASNGDKGWVVDRRALRAVDTLVAALRGTAEDRWETLDGLMTLRRGPALALQAAQISAAAKELGKPWDKVPDKGIVVALQNTLPQRLGLGGLSNEDRTRLSFMLFGPRDAFDAAVLSAMSDARGGMPKTLDLAATVWSNRTARTLLQADVGALPGAFQDSLTRYRTRADDAGPDLWTSSLHHRWLRTLRSLSPDAERDRGLPAPLTGEAWGLRLLNTQLGSWAELRHDRVPLAKPAQRGVSVCEYPDAYVEPYPALYYSLEEMARASREVFQALRLETPVKGQAMDYFDRFAGVMGKLRGFAEKERANIPFNDYDMDFFNRMVSIDGKTAACTLELEPGGWYADLYFDKSEIIWGAPTITDVHTQQYDEKGNKVGNVLHVATADPRMFAVTIRHDRGIHTQTYRGFVFNYTERTSDNLLRYDDESWSEALLKGAKPKAVPWMKRIMP